MVVVVPVVGVLIIITRLSLVLVLLLFLYIDCAFFQSAMIKSQTARGGNNTDTAQASMKSTRKKTVTSHVNTAAAVVAEEEGHEIVDSNKAHELSVEMKPYNGLGHCTLRLGILLVPSFEEDLWFIHSGL